MKTQINPYLTFNGNCREAMTFYKHCLGGELTMQTVGESPMAKEWPASTHNSILHASLTNDNIVLMASDMMSEKEFVQSNTISLSLNCSTEEEIRRFFANFSDGAKINDPLADQFWGAIFGQLQDKFGIFWIFNFDKNQQN